MWNELEEDKQLQLSQQEIDRKKGKFKHESKCGNQYIVNAQELKMYNVKYKQDRSIKDECNTQYNGYCLLNASSVPD